MNFPFEINVSEKIRNLLENFKAISTLQHTVLAENTDFLHGLHKNVRAGVIASTLGLSSIDYAKKRYCHLDESEFAKDEIKKSYINAYYCVKQYIERFCSKLNTEGRPDPSNGVFASSVVLERLPASFFCAHLLYQMGYRYEGHAVSRIILEQISWAYVAFSSNDDEIPKIVTTRSITQLRKFINKAGILYGFLSDKTHIDFSNHLEFLCIQNNQNAVHYAFPKFHEYAGVILNLADFFGIVWEMSQYDYIDNPETVEKTKKGFIIKKDRPFFEEMKKYLTQIEKHNNKTDSSV